jgi:hypothetical protein
MMMDLEAFRISRKLSYRRLAQLIAVGGGRRAQAIARGECWPRADRLADIVARTDGEVTIEAMHAKRLQWLAENRGVTIAETGRDAMNYAAF